MRSPRRASRKPDNIVLQRAFVFDNVESACESGEAFGLRAYPAAFSDTTLPRLASRQPPNIDGVANTILACAHAFI